MTEEQLLLVLDAVQKSKKQGFNDSTANLMLHEEKHGSGRTTVSFVSFAVFRKNYLKNSDSFILELESQDLELAYPEDKSKFDELINLYEGDFWCSPVLRNIGGKLLFTEQEGTEMVVIFNKPQRYKYNYNSWQLCITSLSLSVVKVAEFCIRRRSVNS